jgi:hypothetical protein
MSKCPEEIEEFCGKMILTMADKTDMNNCDKDHDNLESSIKSCLNESTTNCACYNDITVSKNKFKKTCASETSTGMLHRNKLSRVK